MAADYEGVIRRLRRGFDWPLTERADGFRYWSRPSTASWEPLSDGERLAVESIERCRRCGASLDLYGEHPEPAHNPSCASGATTEDGRAQ